MVAEVADLQDAYEDSSDEDIMVEDDLYQDEVSTNLRILFSRKKYSPIVHSIAQCARTDLNKRFLPKPMTTTI